MRISTSTLQKSSSKKYYLTLNLSVQIIRTNSDNINLHVAKNQYAEVPSYLKFFCSNYWNNSENINLHVAKKINTQKSYFTLVFLSDSRKTVRILTSTLLNIK